MTGLLLALVVINIVDQVSCPKAGGRWRQLCNTNKITVGVATIIFVLWLAAFGAYTLTLSDRS